LSFSSSASIGASPPDLERLALGFFLILYSIVSGMFPEIRAAPEQAVASFPFRNRGVADLAAFQLKAAAAYPVVIDVRLLLVLGSVVGLPFCFLLMGIAGPLAVPRHRTSSSIENAAHQAGRPLRQSLVIVIGQADLTLEASPGAVTGVPTDSWCFHGSFLLYWMISLPFPNFISGSFLLL